MSILDTTYYAMTRVRQQGPEARDWATVDKNPEVISLILRMFELHTHTGTAAINYPGYDPVPASIIYPTLTENSSGGVLSPGTTIGVRLAYVNSLGLETQASSERTITFSPAALKPLSPQLVSQTATTGTLNGGTYVYAITKVKGTGETTMSDVLTVSVNYDQAYAIAISFDSIGTYSDGTDKINIYRSSGLAGQFQLIGQVNNSSSGTGWTTTSGVTTFTDSNSTVVTQQPPANNTFDANRKLTIDWTALGTAPTAATKMRVYVTQQAGLWSTDHLLTEVDIASGVFASNFVYYLGSETLGSGWPLNATQIPSSPAKVNLATEATGAPVLTADMDFAHFKANNLVLGSTSVSVNGGLWYDSVNVQFKGFAGGSMIVLSQQVPGTNYVFNPSAEATDPDNIKARGNGAASGFSTVTDSSGTRSKAFRYSWGTGLGMTGNALQACFENGSVHGAFGSALSSTAIASSTLANPTSQMAVVAGDIVGGTIQYRFDPGTTLINMTNAPTLKAAFFNSSNAYLSSVTLATGATPATSASMNTISGTGTAPTNAARAVLYWEVVASTTPGAQADIHLDSALLTKNVTLGGTVAYLDGTSPNGSWSGTADASTSTTSGYSHATEEAGGHKAQNITFGTSNVGSVLSRIADTADGSRIQVQPVYQAFGATSAPTTASTSWSNLAEMTLSVTPQFSGQWLEIVFQGNFQINFAGGTVSVGIDVNADGSPGAASVLSYTAPYANAYVPLVIHRYFAAPSFAAVPVTVTWAVSSGAQATAVGIERALNVKPVF